MTRDIPLYPDRTPTEEGHYIFKGKYSGHVELIHVLNAVGFRGTYLGIVSHRGRNVLALQGSFSEKLNFPVQ
jgi:hypothetical protein